MAWISEANPTNTQKEIALAYLVSGIGSNNGAIAKRCCEAQIALFRTYAFSLKPNSRKESDRLRGH